MVRRGADRIAQPPRHYGLTPEDRAKLAEVDIRAIRDSSETGQVLADRYGVAREHIWAIRQRIFWKHTE